MREFGFLVGAEAPRALCEGRAPPLERVFALGFFLDFTAAPAVSGFREARISDRLFPPGRRVERLCAGFLAP